MLARARMPEENSSKGIVSSARPVTLLQLTAIAEATKGMAYGDDYRFHEKNLAPLSRGRRGRFIYRSC